MDYKMNFFQNMMYDVWFDSVWMCNRLALGCLLHFSGENRCYISFNELLVKPNLYYWMLLAREKFTRTVIISANLAGKALNAWMNQYSPDSRMLPTPRVFDSVCHLVASFSIYSTNVSAHILYTVCTCSILVLLPGDPLWNFLDIVKR